MSTLRQYAKRIFRTASFKVKRHMTDSVSAL